MDTGLRNFIAIMLFMILAVGLLSKHVASNRHDKTKGDYKGIVTEKYLFNDKKNIITPRIVFYCDSLDTFVDIVADKEIYSKLKKGDTISVELKVEK